MSKLLRKTLLQFGSTANPASEIGQFGAYATLTYGNDIDLLQAGTAWPRGWFAETIATRRPFIQDQNAVDFVFGYMLCYLLQMGVPEWDAGTTYYINSIVQGPDGSLFRSLADNNLNNAVTDGTKWANAGGDPTGSIKMYAGSVSPSGYLICDGSAINRTTYATLFSICGTAYGAGDGSSTFNIPDLRTKVPVGFKSGDSNFGALGAVGGEVNHTLTTAEMPTHTHTSPLYSPNNGGLSGIPQNTPGGADSTSGPSNPAGGGAAHNNLQPFLTLNYIIKT